MLTFDIFVKIIGKGGKNRRRGKNENESEKRELVFKEDGQGNNRNLSSYTTDRFPVDLNLITMTSVYFRVRSS